MRSRGFRTRTLTLRSGSRPGGPSRSPGSPSLLRSLLIVTLTAVVKRAAETRCDRLGQLAVVFDHQHPQRAPPARLSAQITPLVPNGASAQVAPGLQGDGRALIPD